jgi:hypothetical protein
MDAAPDRQPQRRHASNPGQSIHRLDTCVTACWISKSRTVCCRPINPQFRSISQNPPMTFNHRSMRLCCVKCCQRYRQFRNNRRTCLFIAARRIGVGTEATDWRGPCAAETRLDRSTRAGRARLYRRQGVRDPRLPGEPKDKWRGSRRAKTVLAKSMARGKATIQPIQQRASRTTPPQWD